METEMGLKSKHDVKQRLQIVQYPNESTTENTL